MMRMLVLLAISGMVMELAMAATYNVGGSTGWDTSSDMQTWASQQTFAVGDSLVFQYTSNHDVTEVSKSDYDNCAVGNAVQSYSGGNTAITLSSPGKRYFICGTPPHCSQGMKLEVDTLAASAPPTPSPLTPTPTPSPVTPVSSPPPTGPAPPPTASPVTPESSPAPKGSAPPPTESAPSPSGLSPIPPPPSSAHKHSSTLAFGFALIMLFAL